MMASKLAVMAWWGMVGGLFVLMVVGISMLHPSCSCMDAEATSQVITNRCECQKVPARVTVDPEEASIDFTVPARKVEAEDTKACTVWVLVEHMNKMRTWVDTSVACKR